MRRTPLALVAALALAALTVARPPAASGELGGPGPPGTGSPAGIPGGGTVPWFLAIGDSITYGTSAAVDGGRVTPWPVRLGRMLAAGGRPWMAYNLACPGETTATYRIGCPFRVLVPALASGTSQRDAALRAIRHHPGLRLIVVALGANDLLAAERESGDSGELQRELTGNLLAIVDELGRASPGTPVVVANLYDLSGDPTPDSLGYAEIADAAISAVAGARHLPLADFYAAVNAPPFTREHYCLSIDCAHGDIHPTDEGQRRLAAAVLRALGGG